MLAAAMPGSLPFTSAAVLTRPGAAHRGVAVRFAILDVREPEVRRAARGAIFAVADGVGSTDRADEAAEAACETLKTFFRAARPASEDLLLDVVEAADAEVRLMNLGCSTLAGIWLAQDRVRIFSLGDSQVYRLRGDEMTALTRPRAGQGLTTYLGMGVNVRPSTELATHDLLPGDRFLLLTDGVLGVFSEEELRDAALRERDCLDLVTHLERIVDARRPRDDATLMAVEVIALEADEEHLALMSSEP